MEPPVHLKDLYVFNYDPQSQKVDSQQNTNSIWDMKIKPVEKIFDCLKKEFRIINWYQDHRVCVLDFFKLDGLDIELAAKALFRYIGKQPNQLKDGQQKEMLFAVYLENQLHIQEFIRDFSAFFDDQGKNEFMQGVQIAICSYNQELRIPEVNFLLAGISLSSARDTAEIFAYYNSESALPLIPQLSYLCSNCAGSSDAKTSEAVEPFPFDLYLRDDPKKTADEDPPEENVMPAPSNSCWFLRRMARLIDRDIREQALGCKINNIHVRLGSKMHIEDFFEAELLFQNVSVVSRFAFLIVQVILKQHPTERKPILLAGYENYSTILLEYVVQFLRECRFNAMYGLYGFDDKGKGRFFPSPVLEAATIENDSQVITVYPIGTTLGTVYQMADSVQRYIHIDKRDVSGKDTKVCLFTNICVLVVVDKNKKNSLSPLYWKQEEIAGGNAQSFN